MNKTNFFNSFDYQFNRTQYIKLLKKERTLNLSLEEQEQLNFYYNMLDSELDFQIKEAYLQLIESFLDKKSTSLNFCGNFIKRYQSNLAVLSSMEENNYILIPQPKSKDFGDLIQMIFESCEAHSKVIRLNLVQQLIASTELMQFYDKKFYYLIEEYYIEINEVLEI